MIDTLLRLPASLAFRTLRYRGLNRARLDHLQSLGLPLVGRSVLDVGAAVGDHAQFYRDRSCTVSCTDVRPVLLSALRWRFPHSLVYAWNLEDPDAPCPPPHEIVHCYGVLYHVRDPALAFAALAKVCGELLLIESRVCADDGNTYVLEKEKKWNPTEAISGTGCRPSRAWIARGLQAHFPYVYFPKTQPRHPEFPLDWTLPPAGRIIRAIFVASRIPLLCQTLQTDMPVVYRGL